MKLLEHEGKALLAAAGIAVPEGALASSAADAEAVAARLGGRVVIKAQVQSGGRGKVGGVVVAASADGARVRAERLLGAELLGETVEAVLVEEALEIADEAYLAVAVDTSAGVPVLLYSATGGVDIEDDPEAVERLLVDPRVGLVDVEAAEVARVLGCSIALVRAVYDVFVGEDALLVEVNPLVTTPAGSIIAADAKVELDDAAAFRHDRVGDATVDAATALEHEAADLGLRLIELGGEVAVLANGAGLTMTTMDAVVGAGGRPANFLEIGGDAYTKAVPALRLVLAQPGVKSVLVNFCGAFARCDVMTAGVVEAWEELEPDLPVFFSVHGTGRDEARAMLRDRLGVEPFERMDDAVAAAVEATGR